MHQYPLQPCPSPHPLRTAATARAATREVKPSLVRGCTEIRPQGQAAHSPTEQSSCRLSSPPELLRTNITSPRIPPHQYTALSTTRMCCNTRTIYYMIKSQYKIRAKGRKRRESHWGGQRSRAPHSPAGPEQISPFWQVLRRRCVQCPPGPASWRSPALPSAPPCWGAGGPRGLEVSRRESSQLASWSAWCRCPGPAGNDRAIREERQRTLKWTGKVSGEVGLWRFLTGHTQGWDRAGPTRRQGHSSL